MSDLEPRLHAWRPDLADARLKGQVPSSRYNEGTLKRLVAASAPLKSTPRSDAPFASELIRGEVVRIFEETIEGWAWGQNQTDGYVGYLPSDALGPLTPQPTHRVVALRTFIYPGPDMKLPPLAALSLGATVALAGEAETRGTLYRLLAGGEGAVGAVHVAPLAAPPEPDFVAVAERFRNVPYLWGGRTSLGLDCSALVQLSLMAAGVAVPRDTDMQAAAIGGEVPLDDLRRGDLVFWPGHVAIARDAARLVHASGYHMAVVEEAAAEALKRIGAKSGPPTVRRL